MTKAEKIVESIIIDILGRKGIGNAWENIDEDIQIEMAETWISEVDKILGHK